jgi:hypothetical protein
VTLVAKDIINLLRITEILPLLLSKVIQAMLITIPGDLKY